MDSVSSKLTASLEDYLEAIYHIARGSSVARSKDIAQALGVAKPSVTSALKALCTKGLINYQPYGYISLTPAGTEMALAIVDKHSILKDFFADILDIEPQMAATAACELEHSLGTPIISKLLSLVEFIRRDQKAGSGILKDFKAFHKNRTKQKETGNILYGK